MSALHTSNLNLYYKSMFKLTGSTDNDSFYPQIAYFANHANEQVRNDSLASVRVASFIIGDGTAINPYFIRNESDWLLLADSTTSGNDYKGRYFIVNNDIFVLDFTGEYTLLPVGNQAYPFNGTLDGQGINFLVQLSNNLNYQALFGHVGEDGHVRNISVSGEIKGAQYTAAIASLNAGIIESVYNQANITGTNYTASIVASNTGIVKMHIIEENCRTNNVGGILAYLEGTLFNTYNTGVIYGRTTVGAIVGLYESGVFTNSYYDKTILESYRNVGNNIKPAGAVGSTYDGTDVLGLDKRFMIGPSAIGTNALNMNFIDHTNVWTTTIILRIMEIILN